MKKPNKIIIALGLLFCSVFTACNFNTENIGENVGQQSEPTQVGTVDLSSLPAFSGNPWVVINGNQPEFKDSEITATAFEIYSELDALGRCGVTIACIGVEIMPTEERGNIGQIKPTGWHTIKYDFVDGKYLYNRCHLIGFNLTGENANKQNLITGTRYLNTQGMLAFENMVADYIKETDNHVMYRVTPIFEGNNLVASGVQMEAWSVEDSGDGICFNVYCYNNQPGVTIDYATGASWANEIPDSDNDNARVDYILNINSKRFHLLSCSSVELISDKNKDEYTGNKEDLLQQGYKPCGSCKP